MNEFKVTPGPWKARNERIETTAYYDGRVESKVAIIDIQGGISNAHVVEVRKTERLKGRAAADANLIAAAPELLESLQEILSLFDKRKNTEFYKAKAAIAKAIGEP